MHDLPGAPIVASVSSGATRMIALLEREGLAIPPALDAVARAA